MIAEHLHLQPKDGSILKAVGALPNNEYHQWRAYIVWKAARMELARA